MPSVQAAEHTCLGRSATIVGTGDHDSILGTDGDDVIVGLAWGDSISGGLGNDVICGGRGNDSLVGGPGNDLLAGGNGQDDFDGGGPLWLEWDDDDGNDRYLGGLHQDSFYGTDGDDVTNGGGGNDTALYYRENSGPVIANLATDRASGAGDDLLPNIENLIGTPFGDVLVGDGGPNLLYGAPIGESDASDAIFGNGGDDQLSDGVFGDDHLDGGPGDDDIEVGPGDDQVNGGPGTDTLSYPYITLGIVKGVSVDLAAGTSIGQGADLLAAIENLIGTQENDLLSGDEGPNVLSGGFSGEDTLVGRGGDDTIDALDFEGKGVDSVDGGPETDTCMVDPADIVINCEA
jgi:Ca2+-binding RTX toxin-like protein